MITRRIFLGMLTAALGAARLAFAANPMPRVGFLGNGNPAQAASVREALERGLRELGWRPGENLVIEYRWAEGDPERLPALITELIKAGIDVMVVSGPSGLRAARNATTTIPIFFVVLTDPVSQGFVQSLARPGGNVTGLAAEFEELITKQLQLLKEAVPNLSRIALVFYPDGYSPDVVRRAEAAVQRLGLAGRTIGVNSAAEFESAFKTARSERAGAVHVLPSPFFNARRSTLIELAAKYRLPAFYEFSNYVREGGLMSYGPNIDAMFGRTASYIDRILKGAKPGDLPIEQPTVFELAVNLKTAKSLGLTFPQSILQRVDEVVR